MWKTTSMKTENPTTKICSLCKVEKPTDEFGKRKRIKESTGEVYYGLRSRCIPCERVYHQKWKGKYYAANRDEVNRKRKIQRAADPEKAWASMIKTRYGVTAGQYYETLEIQGGGCGICGKPNAGREGQKRLHVDHNHVTGNFRGLLCARCNTALGKFDDDTKLLQKAVHYLLNNRETKGRPQEPKQLEPIYETHIRGCKDSPDIEERPQE
jgi:hypothetical protein